MNTLGNIFWLLLGGIVTALLYFVAGLIMCVTIIGIPFGLQMFKIGAYSLWPFGKELGDRPNEPSCLGMGFNILWIMFGWWEIAILHALCGVIFCLTIVGIPLGLAHFKIAMAALLPFGKEIRNNE